MVSVGPNLLQEYSTIVPRLYAEGHCSWRPNAFPLTHTAIAKPASETDPNYVWVRSVIAESSVAVAEEPLVHQDKFQTLGNTVRYLQQQHNKRDATTGLPYVREEIRYSNENARSIAHQFEIAEDITAPTVSNMLEAISSVQACMQVQIDKPHKNVVIDFPGAIKHCPSRPDRAHCATEECK